ncbi:cell envelope protein SmpA [Brevirhabdus pacifica]|uniref:Cell envelope protein SmpA n=1 Tax=Brevirhabdus pacifica TaxID=1267768 RepID=A0A1U7DEX3_9RHOB|nr:outer membrane protein assembly factor BamE [Brevirhabdus pacifica]APX88495.1 cell envelope protein SmpA [Brevirhabdus pacifica]OWU79797.1 SmpA/OmlA [Loktanella sp. 22II-4b]PJJ87025.1 Beta-barrel assembly machine subunit BamE [Brevirhabdus pacifica]
MRLQRKAMRMMVLGGLLLIVAGCAKIYRNHGYVPTDQDLAQVRVGVDTRESLTETIGVPTSSGVIRETAWYYVGSRFEQFAFRAPREISREIVAISFGGNGKVRNVERFGLEDGRVVTLSRRVTDSNIQGVSFLRQLFGSVGAVNLGQFFD